MEKRIWTTIKTFGVDYDDLSSILNNIDLLLNILTINIYNVVRNPPHALFYIITSLSVLCYLYVYTFSMAWMVIYKYGRDNMKAAALVVSLSSCSVTCLIKFVFMKIYAKDIQDTVDQFLKCDAQVIPNTRFARTLRKRLRLVKKRALAIWIFVVSDGIIYIMIPILTPGRHLPLDLYLIYGLEPIFESPNYEIALLITNVSICFGVYTMVTLAVYVIIISGYNEAQMYALSEELQNVWADSLYFYNNIKHRVKNKTQAVYIKEQVMNEFIRIRLRDVIKFHIININLSHNLDKEFRSTIAIEYGLMTFSIIAELLAGLENTYLQLPYTIAQVFMDCLAGQRLIDACDYFERAVYSCRWEDFDVANQKTIQLILVMSQKTLTLSAGGVTKLNFNSLMMILKSTYSAYTTLKSVIQ